MLEPYNYIALIILQKLSIAVTKSKVTKRKNANPSPAVLCQLPLHSMKSLQKEFLFVILNNFEFLAASSIRIIGKKNGSA